jgi:DNA-binding NtrC family response regulator
MQNILKTIEKVAVSDLSVRIVGESGSGKEWLASLIHQLSARAERKFVHVDCAELPSHLTLKTIFGWEIANGPERVVHAGVIEKANGGTIYFDRLSSLPKQVQTMILSAFEQQHFRRVGGHEEVYINVRAIEGVTIPYDEKLLHNRTRVESSRRLGQVCINIPPLRERRDDIPMLIKEFLEESNERYGTKIESVAPETLALLLSYQWPGNIRELRTVIDTAAAQCTEGFIHEKNLPRYVKCGISGGNVHHAISESFGS